jgi:Protein of unknown function (DUF3307)
MLVQFVFLLVVHWFADFVLQTHWQASNKSARIDALARHVLIYTIVFAVASMLLLGVEGAPFAGLNGLLHLATDYVTSRQTSRLYAEKRYHDFFVIVGLDQLIHQVTIAITLCGFFHDTF